MVTRSSSIGAAFSAALVVLTHATSSVTMTAAEEQNGGDNQASLRGAQASSSLEEAIPLYDTRRKTDPLELALDPEKVREMDEEHEESIYGDEEDGDEESDGRRRARNRELGDGNNNKRKQRRKNNGSNNANPDYEKACSGARPRKCGCRNVYQSDYRGNVGITENGLSCRAWTVAEKYPGQGLEDGAVCRNPDAVAGRTWCFVDHPDVLWDYCDVDACDDEFHYPGANDVGHQDTTGTNVDVPGCVSTARYYEVGEDVAAIANSFDDDRDRSHWLGGVVRLAAHDFMDYDVNDLENPMGMDGCLDWNSLSNAGLNTIWNAHSPLFHLHERKYGDVTKGDFWVMAANAVIRLTSVGNALDLKPTFYWGRKEADGCPGAADRLPSTENCRQVEGVFLQRMGMKWKDAVALLGAHTLGRAHSEFSGHHGTWMPNDKAAQVFDKRYYQELVSRSWSPRIMSQDPFLQDWSTGDPSSDRPKMMLNTDMCLFYNIEESGPCCSRFLFDPNGRSRCESHANKQCTTYDATHERWEASRAVRKYLGGSTPNDSQEEFYKAFKLAWYKATINGMDNLHPLMDTC